MWDTSDMLGLIHALLEEFIKEQFGLEKWQDILQSSGAYAASVSDVRDIGMTISADVFAK